MSLTTELLAPAGSPDAGYAALAYGADAVYLGMAEFSARATADNFTADTLRPFVGYAHGMERPRKVFVAINTLVQQGETSRVLEMLAVIAEIGVDAVIIQDLGVLRVARKFFPELEVHASTQMAIHNPDGALFAKRLGFKRVILARELTLEEIAAVADVPGIEVETFVHGALCYAYSGLCLLSSHLRGSSGNRGRCSYLCRERFNCGGVGGHPMSMKDLNVAGAISDLSEAGVDSFKIEGRKKSPLYVAAVTDYYRRLFDGELSQSDQLKLTSDINTIFAREQTSFFVGSADKSQLTTTSAFSHSGAPVGTVRSFIPVRGGRDRIQFTLEGRRLEKHDGLQVSAPEHDVLYGFCAEAIMPVGGADRGLLTAVPGDVIEVALPDGHPHIPVGSVISCISSTEVKRSYSWQTPRPEPLMQSITLDVDLDIRETTLQARGRFAAHGQRLEAVAGLSADTTFSLARKDPEPMCHTAFAKFGGTMFRLGELIIDNPDGRFVPMSTLNELRRSLADSAATALEGARAERIDSIASKTAVNCSGIDEDWCVVVDKVSYLSELTTAELHGLSEVIVTCGNDAFSEDPFEVAEELGIVDRLRLALPAIVRNRERSTLTTRMQHGLDHGVRRWQVSNLYALELLEQMGDGLDIRGDWPLYATNRFSIDELLDWGLTGITASPEDSRGNLATLFAAYPGICVPVYQDTPLAMSEACLHAGQESCDTCGDRRGYREMPMQSDRDELLAVTRDCRTVVINDQPYALASKLSQLRDMGAKRFRMDFVWRRYTASRVAELFRQIMTGTLGECHCGNFERGSF